MTDFLINSKSLEQLKDDFVKSSSKIREFAGHRPILIRHHDDVDGYGSGFILEKSIKNLIPQEKHHIFVSRNASRTPYYDYIDALRDLSNHLYKKSRFNESPPLVILSDLGSNEQSIEAIKRLQEFGFKFMIIDHHNFDKENYENAVSYINPHSKGLGSNLCAAILACELANILAPGVLDELRHLPAVCAIADKSTGDEVFQYVKMAGITADDLEKWSIVLDHEFYNLKFPESAELLGSLFEDKNLVKSIYPKINSQMRTLQQSILKFANVKKLGQVKLVTVKKDDFQHLGYATSKISRLAFDLFEGERVIIIHSHDIISIRSNKASFKVPELISLIDKALPHAMVSGGGHDLAGAIRFNPGCIGPVLEIIESYIKK